MFTVLKVILNESKWCSAAVPGSRRGNSECMKGLLVQHLAEHALVHLAGVIR